MSAGLFPFAVYAQTSTNDPTDESDDSVADTTGPGGRTLRLDYPGTPESKRRTTPKKRTGPIININSAQVIARVAAGRINDSKDEVVHAKARWRMARTVDAEAASGSNPRVLHVTLDAASLGHARIDSANLELTSSARTESLGEYTRITLGSGRHRSRIDLWLRGEHPLLPYLSSYKATVSASCPDVVFSPRSSDHAHMRVRVWQETGAPAFEGLRAECFLLAGAPNPPEQGSWGALRLGASLAYFMPTSRTFSTKILDTAPGAHVQALMGMDVWDLPRLSFGMRVGVHHAPRRQNAQPVALEGFAPPEWSYTVVPAVLLGSYRVLDTPSLDFDLTAFAGAALVHRTLWAAGSDTASDDVTTELSHLVEFGLTPEFTLSDTLMASVDLGASPYTSSDSSNPRLEVHFTLRLGARF